MSVYVVEQRTHEANNYVCQIKPDNLCLTAECCLERQMLHFI